MRRQVLATLITTYDQYVTALADSAFEKRSLATLAQEYGAYLDDRLLWVPSAEPLSFADVLRLGSAAAVLISPTQWLQAIEVLAREVRDHAGWYLLALLVMFLMLRVRRRVLREIDSINQKTRKIRTDRFSYTLEGLAYTALAASMLPAVLVAMGWRWQMLLLPEQARAVAAVLPGVGYVLAVAGFVMLLCAPNGVGVQQLRWSETRQRIWPRVFVLLQILWLPLFMVSRIGDAQSDPAIQVSLGRIAFAASSLVLAYLFSVLLHPATGLPAKSLESQPNSWASRLRRLWYPGVIAIPVALAVQALAGYEYASVLLTLCVLETVLLLVGYIVACTIGTLLLSATGLSFDDAIRAGIGTLSNAGQILAGMNADLGPLAQICAVLGMILGRLEV
ncbi:MAG: hypothetical protein AAFX85_19305, partial [Pseudomonadota bacterium]